MEPKRFGLIGAAGYIAPRHMKAIKDTGNVLIAAMDPNDSVGIIDSYFPDARFFTEIERFDRHLEKIQTAAEPSGIEYLGICSPNYLHDAHVRLALRLNAHAICEKPLVINPWNLDQIADLQHRYQRRIYTVLQLRLHPAIQAFKKKLDAERADKKYEIVLTYITRRGAWYPVSWKGSEEKSGGILMNIGIHFFDLLLWLFGEAETFEMHVKEPLTMSGFLELERARVRWFLSVDGETLPAEVRAAKKTAYRKFTVDGEEVDFSEGFTDLHTEVYREILAGRGFGPEDSRPGIQLVHDLRRIDESGSRRQRHPLAEL